MSGVRDTGCRHPDRKRFRRTDPDYKRPGLKARGEIEFCVMLERTPAGIRDRPDFSNKIYILLVFLTHELEVLSHRLGGECERQLAVIDTVAELVGADVNLGGGTGGRR